MNLPNSHNPLVQPAIHRRRNRQRPSNNRTNSCQKSREGLRARFPVNHLHGRDVVVKEDTGYTALRVDALSVAVRGVIAAHKRALVRGHGVLVRFDAAL